MEETTPLDLAVIGAGPAGLAVAHDAQSAGLRVRVYEKGPVASHIFQYPTFMAFHSTRENLALGGLPLTIPEDKPTRQQYCHYLVAFARHFGLDVRTYHEVVNVESLPRGGFTVHIHPAHSKAHTAKARAVVVAVGSWEDPRRLGVPGDGLAKVRYRFMEAHEYTGRKVLVVGGRNSALETALTVWRGGAHVTIAHRGPDFRGHGVKYWLGPDVENRVRAGQITAHLNSQIAAIGPEHVTLNTPAGQLEIENDFVLPQLGYHAPVAFLRHLGLRIDNPESRPEHNPDTLETHIPGLFVAGVIAAGDVSGHIFIENARDHGKRIVPRLLEMLKKKQRSRQPRGQH